jgi:MarR family transcriptional regulator, organic hydroperoxide resistance regulator
MTTRIDPASAAAVQAFNDAVDEFMRATRRARGRLDVEGSRGELSLSQYHHLDPLERAGKPLAVGEVALQAGVAPPTATRMIDALERGGYVVRERQHADRRLVHVCITPEGRRAVRAKRARIARRRAEVFASLAPAERKQAARILSSLAAAVEALH